MTKLMRTTAYPNTTIDRRSVTAQSAPLKTIPFDYVFEFKLSGKSANNIQDVVKLQDVVEISMQGYFVGVSLGYSFVLDERKNPRNFGPVIGPATIPERPVIIPFFPPSTGNEPFLLAADLTELGVVVSGSPGSEVDLVEVVTQTVKTTTIGSDGTAIVNLNPSLINEASLYALDKTTNLVSEQIKINGSESTPIVGPDPTTNKLPLAGDKSVTVYGSPDNTVQVSILDVSGIVHPIAQVSLTKESFFNGVVGRNTVPLKNGSVDRPLAGGETVLVKLVSSPPSPLSSSYIVSRVRPSTLTLQSIMDGLASNGVALTSGFRFSQRFAAIFSANTPLDQIDPTILASAFEPACGQEDISFLYTIDVVSTGRELQNKPIHNIAGLGIANGDRPFRPFARPITFEPRSVIRIQIEELSTLPGTLYIVLQGYKTLGTGRIPE